MKRALRKKVVCFLLCVAMLVQTIPMEVSANIADTIHNSGEENQKILDSLRKMGGDSENTEQVIDDLQAMGLLDDNGEIVTTASVMVDGTPMSLAEVQRLIEDPATDLGKEVVVDGQRLTLKSIQTMLEIEEELARLEREYFSGPQVEITEEHQESYASLVHYIQENGLTLSGGDAAGSADSGNAAGSGNTASGGDAAGEYIPDGGNFPALQQPSDGGNAAVGGQPSNVWQVLPAIDVVEGKLNHNARIKVDTVKGEVSSDSGESVEYTFTLVDTGGKPLAADYDVTVDYATRDGSAQAGKQYHSVSGTVTLNKGNGFTQTVSVPTIKQDDNSADASAYSRWNGTQSFYLYVSNPENALLAGNMRAQLLKGQIRNDYVYPATDEFLLGIAKIKVSGTENRGRNEAKTLIKGPTQAHRNLWIDGVVDRLFVNKQHRISVVNQKMGYQYSPTEALDVKAGTTYSEYAGTDLLKPIKDGNFYIPLDESVFAKETLGEITIAVWGDEPEEPKYDQRVVDLYTHDREVSVSVDATDTLQVADISAPRGTFMTGSQVPVTVTFSQPVDAGAVRLHLAANDAEIPAREEMEILLWEYVNRANPDSMTLEEVREMVKNMTDKQLLEFLRSAGILPAIELSPQDTGRASRVTFLYEVPTEPGTNVKIGAVAGGKGITGISQTAYGAFDGSTVKSLDVSMERDDLRAFSGIEVLDAEGKPLAGSCGPEDTVTVALNIDQTHSAWLDAKTMELNGKIYLSESYLKIDDHTYPLMLDPNTTGEAEGSRYLAEVSVLDFVGAEVQKKQAEIFYNGKYVPENLEGNLYTAAHFEGGELVFGIAGSFTVEPPVLIREITLDETSYPDNHQLYQMAQKATRLRVESVTLDNGVTGSRADGTLEEALSQATFPEIYWVSGDTDKAAINRTGGNITVKGQGEAAFRAVADNGGFSVSDVEGGVVYAQTPVFQANIGGEPNVLFQEGSDVFVTDKEAAAEITWVESVSSVKPDAVFTVALFEGRYTLEELAGKAPLLSETLSAGEAGAGSYTIPENTLHQVSQNHIPAYTVRVSTEDPNNAAITLQTAGYIVVLPKPASVRFDALESYYILDSAGSVGVRWNLTEYTEGEFVFSVKKNGEDFDRVNTDRITADSTPGEYVLELDNVSDGNLKDVYTVSVKTKNTEDAAYSTDSFLLHVYDEEAMKILIDGKEPVLDEKGRLVMDNHETIRNLYEAEGSEGILKLQRNIQLKNMVSINYADYPWGAVTDQIQWEDGHDDSGQEKTQKTVGIFYPASTYTDIDNMDYESYRPATEFMLGGLEDGETTISATHARTGQKKTLDVSVSTLKNQLYLFQFYPKQETELTYTNGIGEEIVLHSNENGEIAVYDEYGIASDVMLRSGSGKDLYMGTLYQKDLVSQEANPAIYNMYPLNSFNLRRAASLELYLKDEKGNPYTGEITYRGAVYKNDRLCPDTMTGAVQEVSGIVYGQEEAQTLELGSDGRFNLQFDATQFWTESTAGENLEVYDRIDFIYELQFPEGTYYPQLITVNGNLSERDRVDFGENIVTVVPCAEEDREKPFLSAHYVDYHLNSKRLLDVTYHTGSVGPSNYYKEVGLRTVALLWGEDIAEAEAAEYEMELFRTYDARKLTRQNQRTFSYPFSTMAYAESVVSLAPESTGLTQGQKTRAEVTLKNKEGYSYTVSLPFHVTNMINAANVHDSYSVEEKLASLQSSGKQELGVGDIFKGESVLNIGMSMVMKNNGASLMDGKVCQLKLVATEDPTVYKGIILLNADFIGQKNRPMIDYPGEPDAKLNYTPTILDSLKFLHSPKGWAEGKEKDFMKALKGKGVKDIGGQAAGYFECEARYDVDTGDWNLVTTGGGFTVAANMDYAWYANFWAAVLPITMELATGGIVMLDFKATTPVEDSLIPYEANKDDLNDFLTTLRLWFYIRAFAGVGFDYSVIALKLGIFGQVDVDNYNYFLTRSYAENADLKAQRTTLHAELGIKFLFNLLFINYEHVFASTDDINVGDASLGDGYTWKTGQYQEMENWMKQTDFPMGIPGYDGNIGGGNKPNTRMMAADIAGRMGMQEVYAGFSMQGREYLDKYPRYWGDNGISPFVLDENSKLENLEANTYPYANPVLTRDGEMAAYLSDMGSTDLNQTRASYAVKDDSGNYVNPKPFPEDPAQIPEEVCRYCGLKLQDTGANADGNTAGSADENEREGEKAGSNASEAVNAAIADTCICVCPECGEHPDACTCELPYCGICGGRKYHAGQKPDDEEALSAACQCICDTCGRPRTECECICDVCGKPQAECACVCDICGRPLADCSCDEKDTQARADSSLSMDGNKEFAAAVWERQRYALPQAGEVPASTDMEAMLNGTEIYASVYTDGGWKTTRLTDNGTPDLAPVIAAKNGRAIAAWRATAGSSSVSGGDMPLINYDDKGDMISCCIYENGSWGEIQTLYPGDLGKVKNLSAAMLEDGTAAVAYTVDTGGEDTAGYEVQVSVVGTDGKVTETVRLTNNEELDENVRITAVNFPAGLTGEAEEERFVTAWYYGGSEDGASQSDIRFAALKADGSYERNFVDSLSEAGATSEINVGNKFEFIKGENLTLNNLSLIWTEPMLTYNEESSKEAQADVLRAVRFCTEDSKIYLTSALEVAEMPGSTAIDHFDAAMDGQDGVAAVILASAYTGELEQVTETVFTVDPIASMETASAQFTNVIQVDGITIDWDSLRRGGNMGINFQLSNLGIVPIEKFTVKIGDNEAQEFAANRLLPNKKLSQSMEYSVPDMITDADYKVTAVFTDGSMAEAEGTLNLDGTDVKISTLTMDEWGEGKRSFTALLANGNDVSVADRPGTKVYLGLYRDANCTEDAMVPFTVGDTEVQEGETYEITGEQLKMLDAGSLVLKLGYDITPDLEDGTFPEGGITLYARAWAEEEGDEEGTFREITELNSINNQKSISYTDPVKANDGITHEATVEQSSEGGRTTADVTVKNLSMTPSENGNIAVSLLNERNEVIETKLYATDAAELISLKGEQSLTFSVPFEQEGKTVTADYFTASPNQWENRLAALSLSGMTLNSEFNPEVIAYRGDAQNVNAVTVQASAKSADAKVTIQILQQRDGGDVWYTLGEGTGAAAANAPLRYTLTGEPEFVNKVRVVVTPAQEEADALTYSLDLVSSRETTGLILINADQELRESWTNSDVISITSTMEGVTDFTSAEAQYRINYGDWIGTGKAALSGEKISLEEDGKYVISARMEDTEGYRRNAEDIEIRVDRTAPVLDTDNIRLTETYDKLLDGKEGIAAAIGRMWRSFTELFTDGNTRYQLQVALPVTDLAGDYENDPTLPGEGHSGIYAVKLIAGEREYPMTLGRDADGNYVFKGTVAHEFRGALQIEAEDAAGNTALYEMDELVISDSITTKLETACTVSATAFTVEGSFHMNEPVDDMREFGMEYRKKGTGRWTDAMKTADSTANAFTFTGNNLEQGTEYEYRFYYRLVTDNELNYTDISECMTYISVSVSMSSCDECTVTAGTDVTLPGEELVIKITGCSSHTGDRVLVNSVELPVENQTAVYTVSDADKKLVFTAFSREKLSVTSDIPYFLTMGEEDERAESEETLLAWLREKKFRLWFDNGTMETTAFDWKLDKMETSGDGSIKTYFFSFTYEDWKHVLQLTVEPDYQTRYWKELKKAIEKAESGQKLVSDCGEAEYVPSYVLAALAGKSGVTLKLTCQGETLVLTSGLAKKLDSERDYTWEELQELFAEYLSAEQEEADGKEAADEMSGETPDGAAEGRAEAETETSGEEAAGENTESEMDGAGEEIVIPGPDAEAKKPFISLPAAVGIGVGVLVLVGIVILLILRKRKAEEETEE